MIPSVSTSREMIRGRPAEWKQNHRMEKQSVEQIHRSCLTNKSFISYKKNPLMKKCWLLMVALGNKIEKIKQITHKKMSE